MISRVLAVVPVVAVAVLTLQPESVRAQPPVSPVSEVQAPDESDAIPLGTVGTARSTEQWNTVFGSRVVRNVTVPTLMPFVASPESASGAGVIVAPGGAFMMLSMDNEGYDVARWLASHGVTAFVLKYRLAPTSPVTEDFAAALMSVLQPGTEPAEARLRRLPGVDAGVEDGLAAMRFVRAHATRWHLDSERVGFLGFSAGAMVAIGVATRFDVASRPAFAASIYGAMRPQAKVPVDAPPVFIALAADDPLLPDASLPIFEAWQHAKRPAELHVYQRGGHGFGLRPQGSSSDHWIEEYFWWLEQGGWLKPRAQ